MSYERTDWKDHIVEKPKTYRMVQNDDGTITLFPENGEIFQQGTPINASNLNNIEEELVFLDQMPGEIESVNNKVATLNDNINTLYDTRTDVKKITTDLNLADYGTYGYPSSVVNNPHSGNAGIVITVGGSTTSDERKIQTAYSYGGNYIYQRTYKSGAWGAWEQLALKSDIVYTDVPASGSVASNATLAITCAIPSGYSPLSVGLQNSMMIDNGILSAVGIDSTGKAKTRWRNVSSTTQNISGQPIRFWFIRA